MWTYKESPEGSDGGPRKSDMSNRNRTGITEKGREQQVRKCEAMLVMDMQKGGYNGE